MIVPMQIAHIPEVTRLNIELDPTVLFAKLGPRFREKIFYKEIVSQEDCFGFVYLDKDRIAGYICCCVNSHKFFENIKAKYKWQLFLMCLHYFIKSPLIALRYLRLAFTVEAGYFDGSVKAEAVSFGVRPDYRSPEYYKRTGINISRLLFIVMLEEYERRGIAYVKFMTASNNILANIFYKNFGLRPVKTFNFLGGRQIMYIADVTEILRKKKTPEKNVGIQDCHSI